MTATVMIFWTCRFNCVRNQKRNTREIVNLFGDDQNITVKVLQRRQIFLHSTEHTVEDWIEKLDKFGKDFTAEELDGRVFWIDSRTNTQRRYFDGLIVD